MCVPCYSVNAPSHLTVIRTPDNKAVGRAVPTQGSARRDKGPRGARHTTIHVRLGDWPGDCPHCIQLNEVVSFTAGVTVAGAVGRWRTMQQESKMSDAGRPLLVGGCR